MYIIFKVYFRESHQFIIPIIFLIVILSFNSSKFRINCRITKINSIENLKNKSQKFIQKTNTNVLLAKVTSALPRTTNTFNRTIAQAPGLGNTILVTRPRTRGEKEFSPGVESCRLAAALFISFPAYWPAIDISRALYPCRGRSTSSERAGCIRSVKVTPRAHGARPFSLVYTTTARASAL